MGERGTVTLRELSQMLRAADQHLAEAQRLLTDSARQPPAREPATMPPTGPTAAHLEAAHGVGEEH